MSGSASFGEATGGHRSGASTELTSGAIAQGPGQEAKGRGRRVAAVLKGHVG